MDASQDNFFEKVLKLIKEETDPKLPLISFKHPVELQKILSPHIDVSKPTKPQDLEQSVREVLKYSLQTNRVYFRNQLYGGPDPYGLAGAWIAEAFNTSQYTYEVAPAFTLIEQQILQHSLKLFGIPEGDGIFSPGGSISLMYSVVAARYKAFPQIKTEGMRNLPEMVILTSEDSHYSVCKAAHWLGFGTKNVIKVKVNESGQMNLKELDNAISVAKADGKYPLMANATAGTTVLGAVDDIHAIADICEKNDLWLHVDACWGGSLILSKTHRVTLKGIQRAQSISWNPHKMLGTPLQCSLFLVRFKGLLHSANAAAAQYLFQQDKFYDVSYDTGDKSIQCGRKIDAFKLWVMWKARGDSGMENAVDHAMAIATHGQAIISKRPGFKLVGPSMQCPNLCFWYVPPFMRNQKEDQDWLDLLHQVTAKIKAELYQSAQLLVAYSPLRHHKNFFRMAITCHPRVTEKDILSILECMEKCGSQLKPELM